ncbi:hypothetical protein V6N12_022755 [Hibiscus sabdariffa]|uniref:Uncharacterized protein n=1 Tax=Hibiscus sabdariffa TaxID=183260 RepID=A0ABR2FVM2_9ROSI
MVIVKSLRKATVLQQWICYTYVARWRALLEANPVADTLAKGADTAKLEVRQLPSPRPAVSNLLKEDSQAKHQIFYKLKGRSMIQAKSVNQSS